MRRLSPLLAFEAAALALWVGLAGWLVLHESTESELRPIDPAALQAGPADETWFGIYFQDQKVGYAVQSESPTADGGRLLRSRSAFEVAAFGEIKRIVTVGDAQVDPQGQVRRFDFFMESNPVHILARGEVQDDQIVMELVQAGELQTLTLPIDEPPQIQMSISSWIADREDDLAVGQVFELPYFDPVTMASQTMRLEVEDIELVGAEEAYWIQRAVGDIETRFLVTPSGKVLREESALGFAMVAETREQAETMPTGVEPVNIIALSSVTLTGGQLLEPRRTRVLSLVIHGVEPDRLRDEPPLQQIVGDTVTVTSPLLAELPADLPKAELDPALQAYLGSTVFMPLNHPDIQDRAEDVLGDVSTRREAVEVLNDWVYGYLIKAPTMGVPNALEILQVGQGDCNEHTALFVALARAQGIPSRVAAGLVYSDTLGGRGGFYYHAWPEVYFGPEAGWVPVDPTFGQFPADATHVKVVEGDLDKQVEIMGVMGRLSFELVEAR